MKYKFLLLMLLAVSLAHGQMPAQLTNAEKVYGLSKFWQEVNYNFVYLDKVDREAWDAYYIQLIDEVQQTSNDYEYYRLLEKFCAQLKDGHTDIYMPESIRKQLTDTDFGKYKIKLSNIDGKAIVTAVNKTGSREIPVGSEILKVNGMEVQEHIKAHVKPYISTSANHILEDWGVSKMLHGVLGTSLTIEYRIPGNEIRKLSLKREKAMEEEMLPNLPKQELLEFKWLDKNTAYLALNSFGYDSIIPMFESKLPELAKAKSLVIDLRNNTGGNTNIGFDILKHFVKDSVLYGSQSYTRKHLAAYKAWGRWTQESDTIGNPGATETYLAGKDLLMHDFENQPWKIEEPGQGILIPIVVLLGHNTASAAEDFLIFTENQDHIIKIGEPSFGSTGQPFVFELPKGAAARICTKKDTYPDGREFVGYGIQPDILVKKTVDDFINNQDPVLEASIDYLKELKLQ
ncbi:S41 family peptidase [Gramella sp. GC03-9]|uniref:S41 family peptidase n=1 Tax=Christiangramia oceanisediminis TaxID=2920386 RepID=A0A9X2I1A9_9FLAO|nr:S41 family peptidase [Gramella oceanisediminis]MCP9198815.1 S41 family peptidase [Gramella oceanisediminis]